MKLICTQDNFKKIIFICERVVSKQNTLPILNNILLEAEKGSLKLSATNLEIGVVAKISAKVEKTGKITIPAKLLSNFSNNLPGGENITIESVDQGIKIKSDSVKAVIKGLSANDFPLIPKKNTEFLLNIPADKFKNILSKIMSSVAINEARTELTGVNLVFGTQELFFASTDSFRLSEYKLKSSDYICNQDIFRAFIEKKDNIIIPANTLVELGRIISEDSKEGVNIAIEEGQIFFEFDNAWLVSRLINGKYPEYKHIMPKEYKTRTVGEKKALLSSVKMASIFASGKSSEISLKINSETKKIVIEARSVEIGENSTELKFDVQGPSQEAVFNSKYILDGINTISTSQISLLLNSSSTPVALKEINEQTGEVLNDYTYIVMPIKS